MLRANLGSFAMLLAVASGFGLLLSSTGPAAAASPSPATHTVVIDGLRFDPQNLTVKAGDMIIWVNRDPFPHTVTADGKQFDSHEIASGRSWKHSMRTAGVFAYGCTLHPTMRATLHVD